MFTKNSFWLYIKCPITSKPVLVMVMAGHRKSDEPLITWSNNDLLPRRICVYKRRASINWCIRHQDPITVVILRNISQFNVWLSVVPHDPVLPVTTKLASWQLSFHSGTHSLKIKSRHDANFVAENPRCHQRRQSWHNVDPHFAMGGLSLTDYIAQHWDSCMDK